MAGLRIIARDRAGLLEESLFWSAGDNCVCWAVIFDNRVNQLDLESRYVGTVRLPEPIGWLVERGDYGGFIASLKSGFAELERRPLRIRHLVDPEPDRPGNRRNDAKANIRSCIYAGTMPDDEAPYRFALDRNLIRVDAGYGFAIGPAISADGMTMFHADSRVGAAYRMRIESDGSLSGREIFLVFQDDWGCPQWNDGQCQRRVADRPLGRSCFRMNATLNCSIAFPISQITEICFGVDRMLVTSAAIGIAEEAGGALFEADSGVRGLAPCHFVNCSAMTAFLRRFDQRQRVHDQLAHRGACALAFACDDRVVHRGVIGNARGASLDPVGEADRVPERRFHHVAKPPENRVLRGTQDGKVESDIGFEQVIFSRFGRDHPFEARRNPGEAAFVTVCRRQRDRLGFVGNTQLVEMTERFDREPALKTSAQHVGIVEVPTARRLQGRAPARPSSEQALGDEHLLRFARDRTAGAKFRCKIRFGGEGRVRIGACHDRSSRTVEKCESEIAFESRNVSPGNLGVAARYTMIRPPRAAIAASRAGRNRVVGYSVPARRNMINNGNGEVAVPSPRRSGVGQRNADAGRTERHVWDPSRDRRTHIQVKARVK